jgi:tRNA modification GTPase
VVEAEGVRRARRKIASADLVLLVVDGSRPIDAEDRLALEACGDARVLLVVNKSDLPAVSLGSPFSDLKTVRVSAHTGSGIDELRLAVESLVGAGGGADSRESILLSDRRHREALLRSREAIDRFCVGTTSGLSPEFLALELRETLQSLGEITGETTPDEILEKIFSRFCIGK